MTKTLRQSTAQYVALCGIAAAGDTSTRAARLRPIVGGNGSLVPIPDSHKFEFASVKGKSCIHLEYNPHVRAATLRALLEPPSVLAAGMPPINYEKWEEASRAGGILDQLDEHLDITARRGKWSAIPSQQAGKEVQAAHDTFTFLPDQSGATLAVSYASPDSQELCKRAMKADEQEILADLAASGRETTRAPTRCRRRR